MAEPWHPNSHFLSVLGKLHFSSSCRTVPYIVDKGLVDVERGGGDTFHFAFLDLWRQSVWRDGLDSSGVCVIFNFWRRQWTSFHIRKVCYF